jgi:hypothetical protein
MVVIKIASHAREVIGIHWVYSNKNKIPSLP